MEIEKWVSSIKDLFKFYKKNVLFCIILFISICISITISTTAMFFISFYTQNIWLLRLSCALIFSILPFICCSIFNIGYSRQFEYRLLTFLKASIFSYFPIFVLGFIISLFVSSK
jgi:hypothetical protein